MSKKRMGDASSRDLLRRTELAIGRAADQVRSGDCGAAFDNMMDAGVLLGGAEEILAGSKGAEVGVLVDLDRELVDLREGFVEKCLRSRHEGSSAPRTFRRRR